MSRDRDYYAILLGSCLRHRSFTFQEFSQRYANPDQAFDDMFEKREARMQDPEKNRQNSVEVDDSTC